MSEMFTKAAEVLATVRGEFEDTVLLLAAL
jgi:hypothetical protein